MKNSKILKAGFGYTIGNILLKGVNFLTIPIFTRILSTNDYGMFNTYTAFESILFIIVGLCLHSSLKNAKYDYSDNYDEYISSNILLSICSFLMLLLVLNIIYPFIESVFGFSRLILNILIFHSYGTSLITFYNQKIALDYDYKKFLVISFLNIILNLSLSFVLIFCVFNNQRWFGRIIGTATPLIIIGIVIIYKYFRIKRPKINKEYWKYSLKISLPIIPHGLSQIILSQFDRIMIKRLISAAAVGIYSFSYNISSILITVTNSLETVWSPWFFEKMNKREYKIINENYKKYLSGIILLFVLVVLASNEIVMILGSRSYWEGINTVYPLIISAYFSFIYFFPANVEYYYKKTKFIAIGTCLAAVINIILNYIYIPRYGYIAAAYTTMFSYMFYFIFHYIIYTKISEFKLFEIRVFIIHLLEIVLICLLSSLFKKMLFLRILIALIYIFFYIWYFNLYKLIYSYIGKIHKK